MGNRMFTWKATPYWLSYTSAVTDGSLFCDCTADTSVTICAIWSASFIYLNLNLFFFVLKMSESGADLDVLISKIPLILNFGSLAGGK